MKYFLVLIFISASTAIHYPTSYSNIVQHLDGAVPYSSYGNPFLSKSFIPSGPQPLPLGGRVYHARYLPSPTAAPLNGFPFPPQGFGPAQGQPPNPATVCAIPPANCVKSRYRSLDGSCNNLQNPVWGLANGKYSRLLSARYGDGVSSPTRSITGENLPSARLVSLVVFGEQPIPDPEFTLANMQWGQIITHDMSMQAGGTQSKKHSTRCCTDDGKLIATGAHKTCYPIIVPQNDPALSQVGTECMNFVRTLTDRDRNCPGHENYAQAEQLTVVTAFLDLSLVYGNSDTQNRPLRLFRGGRMITDRRNGAEWLPRAVNVTAACDVIDQTEVCYQAGDVRVNQNPGLTILQTVLLREHNRIADGLQALNPHWDDELTFQEARKINIGQYQHINYYEWLPIFLGGQNMLKNRLIYRASKGSYVNDYDPSVDPSVLNEHATAAFRYFHTQIAGRLDLISEIRSNTGALRLSDWFNRPAILEIGDNFDSLTRGLATQPEDLTDINIDPEVKHFLFRRNMTFGRDLKSFDIQRNRDHGLAGYNDMRAFCGLPRAQDFDDLRDLISPKDLANLRQIYAHVDDIELTVGGALEALVQGTLAGPTFLCILTEQFFRTRVGDRFFYERGSADVGFTREQLSEIRKSSLARLLCDNGNNIQSIQPQAFRLVSPNNKVLPCTSIPQVDLTYWQDQSGFAAANTDQSFNLQYYVK